MSDTPQQPTPEAAEPQAETKPEKPEKSEAPQGIWRGWIRPLLVLLLIITALRSSLIDWNDVPTGSMNPTILEGDRIVINKLSYGFNLPFNGPAIAIPFTRTLLSNPLDFLPGFYWSQPERNDIVTFWKPPVDVEGFPNQGKGMRMVKRVVGVPGDTVAMKNGHLILNGEQAKYVKTGSGLTEHLAGDTRPVYFDKAPPGKEIDPRAYRFDVSRFPEGEQEKYLEAMRNSLAQMQEKRNFEITLGPDEFLMIGDNRDNSLDGRYFGPVQRKQITGKAKFIAVSFKDGFTNPVWSRWFKSFDSD